MSLPEAPPGFSLGADVSQFNGPVDAPLMLASGVSFLYARATYGTGYVDPEWIDTAHNCGMCGLVFGGYGVLVPGHSPEAQADAFCAALESAPGWSLPPALDFELAKGWTAAQAFSAASRWLDVVERRMNARAIVYTGPAFWNGLRTLAHGDPGAEADALAIVQRPLWVAFYGSGHEVIDPTVRAPRLPHGWDAATIWQVGPYGATMPGTHVACDVNFYRGDVSDLEALARW